MRYVVSQYHHDLQIKKEENLLFGISERGRTERPIAFSSKDRRYSSSSAKI